MNAVVQHRSDSAFVLKLQTVIYILAKSGCARTTNRGVLAIAAQISLLFCREFSVVGWMGYLKWAVGP